MPDDLDWVDVTPTEADVVGNEPSRRTPRDFFSGPRVDGPGPGRRGPRWLMPLVVAIAVALAVAHVASSGPDPHPQATQPTDQADTANPNSAIPFPHSPPVALRLQFVATEAGPLQDVVRPTGHKGDCPVIPVGAKPLDRIGAALHQTLPDFRVVDSSRVLDPFSGLCAMQVRAHDGLGTTLVLLIDTPSDPRTHGQTVYLSSGFQDSGPSGTTYVTATTARGWSVQVGAVGPAQRLPQSRDLVTLAQDTRLIW